MKKKKSVENAIKEETVKQNSEIKYNNAMEEI